MQTDPVPGVSLGKKALWFSLAGWVVTPVFFVLGLILARASKNPLSEFDGLGIFASFLFTGVLIDFISAVIGIILGIRASRLTRSVNGKNGAAVAAILVGGVQVVIPAYYLMSFLVGLLMPHNSLMH